MALPIGVFLVEMVGCSITACVRRCPCAQTLTGAPGKSLTAAEFTKLIGLLLSEVEDHSAGDAAAFPLGRVHVQLDRDKAHVSFLKRSPDDRFTLSPVASPDIQKVVEHPLHPFNVAWKREFSEKRSITSCSKSMDLAVEILKRTTADSIDRDMRTLPATLQSIIKNRGDWADDGLR